MQTAYSVTFTARLGSFTKPARRSFTDVVTAYKFVRTMQPDVTEVAVLLDGNVVDTMTADDFCHFADLG